MLPNVIRVRNQKLHGSCQTHTTLGKQDGATTRRELFGQDEAGGYDEGNLVQTPQRSNGLSTTTETSG